MLLTSHSQILQDILVAYFLPKENGTFVDIGCNDYKTISNTFLLEYQHNWTGLGIDINNNYAKNWLEYRSKSKFINGDALSLNYEQLFIDHGMSQTIDFLSIDIEPNTLCFDCLQKIPFDQFTFNTISFETDAYINKNTQQPSREYLLKRGYKHILNLFDQDDFYIHESVYTKRYNETNNIVLQLLYPLSDNILQNILRVCIDLNISYKVFGPRNFKQECVYIIDIDAILCNKILQNLNWKNEYNIHKL